MKFREFKRQFRGWTRGRGHDLDFEIVRCQSVPELSGNDYWKFSPRPKFCYRIVCAKCGIYFIIFLPEKDIIGLWRSHFRRDYWDCDRYLMARIHET